MQMAEAGAKKKILEAVEQLPDDATIEKGLQEADADLTVPHDDVKKRLGGE